MWRIYPYAAPEQDPARQMPAFQVKTRYKLIYMQNGRVDSGRPLVWGSGAVGHPICPASVDQNIEAELPWLPICGQPAVQGEKDYLCAYHNAMAGHGGGVRHLIDMRQINVNYTQPRWLREWRWPE